MSNNHKGYLIAGNWKMNGSLDKNFSLIESIKNFNLYDKKNSEILICPPDLYLSQVRKMLLDCEITFGAQNVSKEKVSGAFTGETSSFMLSDLGCAYCIIGHSERRLYHGESEEIIAEKFLRLLESQITPIFCLGEPINIRNEGNHTQYVISQLENVANIIGIDKFKNTVIAYEPVWAIGTGMSASPDQAQEMHLLLRSFFSESGIADTIRIIYGGSVKPINAKELFSMPDIDGALIGGASLISDDFLSIYESSLN